MPSAPASRVTPRAATWRGRRLMLEWYAERRLHRYAELPEQEPVGERELVDPLVHGLPRAVPGLALDAEEDRSLLRRRALRSLEERRHFARVERIDARVALRRREEHGGVARALADVVVR